MTTKEPLPSLARVLVEDATMDRSNLQLGSFGKERVKKQVCIIERKRCPRPFCDVCAFGMSTEGYHRNYSVPWKHFGDCRKKHRCIREIGRTVVVYDPKIGVAPCRQIKEDTAFDEEVCFYCEYDRNARVNDIHSAMKRSLKNASLSDEIRNKLFAMIDKPYPITSLKESRNHSLGIFGN